MNPALDLVFTMKLDAASRRELADATNLDASGVTALVDGDVDITVMSFEALLGYMIEHSILAVVGEDLDVKYSIDDPDDGPRFSEATEGRVTIHVETSPDRFRQLRSWSLVPPPPPDVARMIFEDDLRTAIKRIVETGR